MAELVDDDLLVRGAAVLWRRLFDGILVLAPDAEEPLHVSSPGALVWALLEHPTSFGGLVSELASWFGLPEEQLRADLGPVLSALRAAGAVVVIVPDGD